MRRHRGDWQLLLVLWAVFTAIGEFLAFRIDLLPGNYAREGAVIDEAYKLLIGMAAPVFAGVAAALLVMFLRHTVWTPSDGPPIEDGAYVPTHKTLVNGWVLASALLAIGVAINPGFVGLHDYRGENRADLVVQVQAQRWSWQFTYENGGVSTTELVLPVDKRVRFDLTSIDIVHSFWVPAFRTKLDTVPGRVTKLYVTPERTGSHDTNYNLRVQCAELCGIDHAKMAVPVRVVEQSDYEAYIGGLQKGA